MSRRETRSGDAPLLAWGEQLRLRKIARQRRNRCLALGVAGLALFGLTIIVPPTPRFLWNASASAPMGLYRILPGATISRGDMVVAHLSEPWRSLAARRHYLPANVPLVKRVAGVPGDRLCAVGSRILLDGHLVAVRKSIDRKGCPMPGWGGCLTLANGQYFLLMDNPSSFDGRYFGATERTAIVGRAVLTWAR